MKKKVLIVLYIFFVFIVFLTSSTLGKYIKTTNTQTDFAIGEKLYFKYERSNLYRNNELAVGVETNYVDDKGETRRRIETMNVAPDDHLVYHFYVSNYDLVTLNYNGIAGTFAPVTSAVLSLPVVGETYDVSCTVTYREVSVDGSVVDSPFVLVTNTIALPPYEVKKVRYEFQVSVFLDDQITNTTSDDYFGATLNVYLYVNAASNIN